MGTRGNMAIAKYSEIQEAGRVHAAADLVSPSEDQNLALMTVGRPG